MELQKQQMTVFTEQTAWSEAAMQNCLRNNYNTKKGNERKTESFYYNWHKSCLQKNKL